MRANVMTDDKQARQGPESQTDNTHQVTEKVPPGTAQVGNQTVPRPDKVSDRSVPDDIEE